MRNQSFGQLLRFLGMALEAGSLLCMLSIWNGKPGMLERLPIDPSLLLSATFVFGVCLWVVGLQLIRRSRQRDGST